MGLYGYQARNLFRQHDVPVLDDAVATASEKARNAAQSLLNTGSELMTVEAQVKADGRGKADGVRLARTAEEAEARARDILSIDVKSHTVRAILISGGVDLDAEYCFSILLDRTEHQYLTMCSHESGIDIETLAIERPEALTRIGIDPLEGIIPAISHQIVEAAGFEAGPLANEIAAVIERLWEVFTAKNATLMEVNPLVKAAGGRIIALDGEVTLDDNFHLRHLTHAEPVDNATTDPLEARAREVGLNYVHLEGEVRVLSSGAGLVMFTLDVVASAGEHHSGMKSANFLNLRGGSSAEIMVTGLEIVTSDPQVRAILVSVLGGITSCDTVTRGIVTAIESLGGLPKPVVMHLDDNSADTGRAILADAAIKGVTVVDTVDGATDVVTAIAEKISSRPAGKEV